MLNKEEIRIIREYLDTLQLLPENRENLESLLAAGKKKELLEQIVFFAELDKKKEAQLSSLSEKVFELESKELEDERARSLEEFSNKMVEQKTEENLALEMAMNGHFDNLEAQIDKINDDTVAKIGGLRDKYRKKLESQVLKVVRTKLK